MRLFFRGLFKMVGYRQSRSLHCSTTVHGETNTLQKHLLKLRFTTLLLAPKATLQWQYMPAFYSLIAILHMSPYVLYSLQRRCHIRLASIIATIVFSVVQLMVLLV
jgi:hypothetical protein